MKYQVVVKPGSRQEKIEKTGEFKLKVWVSAPPVDGKANEAVVRLVAAYLGIPKSRLSIKSGHKGKTKVLEVT